MTSTVWLKISERTQHTKVIWFNQSYSLTASHSVIALSVSHLIYELDIHTHMTHNIGKTPATIPLIFAPLKCAGWKLWIKPRVKSILSLFRPSSSALKFSFTQIQNALYKINCWLKTYTGICFVQILKQLTQADLNSFYTTGFTQTDVVWQGQQGP